MGLVSGGRRAVARGGERAVPTPAGDVAMMGDATGDGAVHGEGDLGAEKGKKAKRERSCCCWTADKAGRATDGTDRRGRVWLRQQAQMAMRRNCAGSACTLVQMRSNCGCGWCNAGRRGCRRDGAASRSSGPRPGDKLFGSSSSSSCAAVVVVRRCGAGGPTTGDDDDDAGLPTMLVPSKLGCLTMTTGQTDNRPTDRRTDGRRRR